jgi:hypothetical protein
VSEPDTCKPSDRCGQDACPHCLGVGGADTGVELLDQVLRALTRYVAFPSQEAAWAVTLWVACTHAQDAWEHATRLVIKSPVKRCGKSRAFEVARELCHEVLATTNISTAALVRSIGLVKPAPTILVDEADTIFATRRGERSEGAEEIRGILNSGHARGWPYIRWDATARKREVCPTFAMAAIAGIGDLPDTIEDRAVIVTMRRRAPGEEVEKFRYKKAVPPLRALRDFLHDWVYSVADRLAEAEPDLPVEDRAADVWEPLVALADAAGGHWPERARQACMVLAGGGTGEDASEATRILRDIFTAFQPVVDEDGDVTRPATDRLATTTLLHRINALEDSPWGGWNRGDGMSARNLAKLLKPYDIKSRTVKFSDGATAKGYHAQDFHDPWSRYVPAYREGFRHLGHQGNPAGREVTEVTEVTDERPELFATKSGETVDLSEPF